MNNNLHNPAPRSLTAQWLFTLVCLFCSSLVFAQQNTIPQALDEAQWQAVPTATGYLSVTSTNSYTGGANQQLELTQFNPLSTAVPANVAVIGYPNGEIVVRDISVAPAIQGVPSYYVCGYVTVAGGTHQMFVLRTSAVGNVTWMQVRANPSNFDEDAVAVVTMPDGGVSVIGNIHNFNTTAAPASNIYTARFMPTGALVWGFVHPCTCNTPQDVNPVSGCVMVAREAVLDETAGGTITQPDPTTPGANSGIVLTGYYKNNTASMPRKQALIMTMTGAGAEVWRNIFAAGTDQTASTEGYDIIQDKDNGYRFAMGGSVSTMSAAGGVLNTNVYYVLATPAGASICNNTLTSNNPSPNGSNEYAFAITKSTNVNNYVLAGPNLVSGRSFATEVGFCGSMPLWFNEFPQADQPGIESIVRNGTAGYYFTSNRHDASPTSPARDIWSASLNNAGNDGSTPACYEPIPHTNLIVTMHQPLTFCQLTSASWTAASTFTNVYAITQNNPCGSCTSVVDVTLTPTISNCCTTITATATGCTVSGYVWSNGTTGTATNSITTCVNGIYTVTVTCSDGCTGTASITISLAPVTLTVTKSNDIDCLNTSATLTAFASGGTAGYTYLWSDGTTGISTTAFAAGVYTVTVTDAVGCRAIVTITVTDNTSVPIIMLSTVTAPQCCVTINSAVTGCIPSTYVWSNGANTANITVCTSGIYTVTVMCANGCTSIKSTSVTVGTPPTISITTTAAANCCTTLTSNVTGCNGTSYLWSNGATTASITVCTSGTYTVTVTCATGCTAIKNISVTVGTPPTVSLLLSSATNCCTIISSNVTGCTATGYAWSNGATGANITTCALGVYTVTVTCSTGCTGTASVNVTIMPAPTVSLLLSSATNCCTIITPNVSGCTASSYAWSNGATGSSITTCTAGIYTVTVTCTTGCTGTASVNVPTIAIPSVNITTAAAANCCTTLTTTVSGCNGTGYVWSNGATTSAITVCASGTYTVTVTCATGCTATKNISVTVSAPPTVAITGVLTFCNAPTTLTAVPSPSGTYTYAWSNGTTTAANTVAIANTYTVTVTNSAGCTATRSVTVVRNCCPNPITTNIRYQVNTTNQQVYYYAPTTTGCTGTLQYQWTFAGGTPATYTGTVAPGYITYATPGIKTVCVKTLCITNNGQDTCRTLCCREINVSDPNCGAINPAFSLTMAASGSAYSIVTSSNTSGTTYLWTLDGAPVGTGTITTTTTIPVPTTSTTVAGLHTLCLTLRRGNSVTGVLCERTICKSFTLLPATCNTASARFAATVNTLGAPYNVVFNGTLSTSAVSYDWTGYNVGAGTSGAALWTSTIASPTINYTAAGTHWICLTINAATGCAVKTCMPIITGGLNCTNNVAARAANDGTTPTDLSQTIISDEVFIDEANLEAIAYPSPTDGMMTVQLNRLTKAANTVTVTDMNGKTIATQQSEIGQSRLQFDLTNTAAGMYFITIQNSHGDKIVRKVVRQ